MGMTPQEIQEKHFHDTFRGYSHEEVDLFLDEVAVAFERLYRENQNFMRRVVDLEEQLKRAQEAAITQPPRQQEVYEEDPGGVTESTLKRMLLIAQETADRAVQEARQRAREIQEQARARADEMMEHAERRVRELSSQRMEKEKELERAKEALRRFDQQYRASFRVFIESQLEALKDLPAAPPGAEVDVAPESPPAFEAVGEGLGFESVMPPSSVGMETEAMPVQPLDQPSQSDIQAGGRDIFNGGIAAEPPVEMIPDAPSGQWADETVAASSGPSDASEGVVATPADAEGPPALQGPSEADGDEQRRGRSRRERRQGAQPEPADPRDEEEDRLIRELFWGDED